MARKLKSDKVLFVATILLVSVSIVMVYSASAVLAIEMFEEPYHFVIRQALWAVMGMAVLAVAMRIDYRTYRNEAFIWAVLGGVALMLVAVLFTTPVNGARRWLGVMGLGIQPSELAKIACVLFAALMLERRMHRINEFSYALAPIVIVTGALCGLMLLEPDLGTPVVVVLIVAVMAFSAGLSYRHMAMAVVLLLAAVTALVLDEPYRLRRMFAFLDPWQDPRGDGFQIIQSRIAVGTGGVTGQGLMEGVQKLFYLPEPHTDFIYAVIGEELGLVGATVILACFLVIAWRGLHIATRAEDAFGSFVALGLTTMIALQAFINMSVVLGLLPTKGIPLPLVSSGGSSLLVSLLGVGMLLNISQHEAVEGRA